MSPATGFLCLWYLGSLRVHDSQAAITISAQVLRRVSEFSKDQEAFPDLHFP